MVRENGEKAGEAIISFCRPARALVSPDGVVPSQMVGVSASVNFSLHHKVQKFSSGTGSPGWFQKKGRKTVVVVFSMHNNEEL